MVSEDSGVNRVEMLEFTGQIDRRVSRVEHEIDALISVKKWLMGMVMLAILQLSGFVYGYGSMNERLDNTVDAVKEAAKDRYYRTDALALERNLRREMAEVKTLMLEKATSQTNYVLSIERRLSKLEDIK